MQIGIRQQRQESRAIDRDGKLSLIARLGPGDARRNDLAVLVDEILEDTDVLVIDFLDAFRGKAAELPAAKELPAAAARILSPPFALALVPGLWLTVPTHCHGVLPLSVCYRRVQYQLRTHAVLAIQEPGHLHGLTDFQRRHCLGNLRHGYPAKLALDLSFHSRLDLLRAVQEPEADERHARRGIAQRLDSGQFALEDNFVGSQIMPAPPPLPVAVTLRPPASLPRQAA